MLSTPNGMRHIQGCERLMFIEAIVSLAKRLHQQIADETGLPIGSKSFMSGKGGFHTANPLQQLAVLRMACMRITDPARKWNADRLVNSAIECVYSWLAHQIEQEMKDEYAGVNTRHRKLVCDAYAEVHGRQVAMNAPYPEWVKVVDKLASANVYPEDIEVGGALPATHERTADDCEEFFLTLSRGFERDY